MPGYILTYSRLYLKGEHLSALGSQQRDASAVPHWGRLQNPSPRNEAEHVRAKLQALVYDILPPTSAVTDYAIGLEKLSANGQFFVGAQMAASL